ncbi:MAG: benzoyl-CoA reductase, bzd-type, subunit N [Clostridia bacterium]|nr:benzoyl-CoA reductase, bzd-type, subunit N [Clostridia bacterium]
MIKLFQKWCDQRHDYAREWKTRTGGKIFGTFCTYVPEEILYAADILPVRVLGSHEPPDVAEPHILGMYCSFCRDVLAQGLKNRLEYLDGITIGQSCLHLRQAYTSWDMHRPTAFSYYLPMPHNIQSERSYAFLESELEDFKAAVEEFIGKQITNEDLDRGIKIVNTNRRLLKQIFELRRQDNPPITGLETMYLVLSSQLVDKRDHNKALEELLEALPQRELDRETGHRLMILGSENDDTAFITMAEGLPIEAMFVIDDHCTGTRYFWNECVPRENRLAAIAARYIERPPCPTKDWPVRKRISHILEIADKWNVDGVVIIQQKYCDPYELDIPAIKQALEEVGLPALFLEYDVAVPEGQFRIRVETFLEMLENEDLF